MKKIKILDIQSISDVITNSSSEVFIVNSNNESIKELIKKLSERDVSYYLDILETESDVKKFLLDKFQSYSFIDEISNFIPYDILDILIKSGGLKELEKFGYTKEALIEYFFPLYKNLIGKIILIFENDGLYPDWIKEFIKISRENNLINFNERQ